MTTLPQPVPSPLSKPDIAQRCPIYASFLDELRRLRRAHIDAPSPDNDPTLCEQLYASFKTFCSTYRKAHPDEDGKYATLWPTYIDKVVLNPKQSRQKRHARSFTTQPPASKVPRTDEPPSSSSSSFRTSDHPLVSSSSDSLSSPSSSTAFVAGACSASHALPEHDVGFQAVVDEIAKLRSEMKQLAAVPLTPSTGELNDVQESKQEELPSVNAQQQQQIEQLAQQLADTQAAEATTQHELAAVRKQLDDMQQRWEQAEKEQLQNEKQTTEKCQLSILQGYVLRACDELVMDCPLYNQPLSSPDQLKYLTKQRTSRVLNCLKDFAALCSTFAEHAQYAVDATSSERQAQKAYRKLSLVLHPDKLLAHIDGERKGLAFVVAKVCAERMAVSDNDHVGANKAEMSEEDRTYHAEQRRAKREAKRAREAEEAEEERAREQCREWERKRERIDAEAKRVEAAIKKIEQERARAQRELEREKERDRERDRERRHRGRR